MNRAVRAESGKEAGSGGDVPGLDAARHRAEVLGNIRDFFNKRDVLEVETPALSRGVSLDSHIDVFWAGYFPSGYPQASLRAGAASAEPSGEKYFLQTSPEPHMKRLLCRGFPDIYQIGKAFRNGERGDRHNPEFTMLEWYRRGFSLAQLMDEVSEICLLAAGPKRVVHKTYCEAFQEVLDIDPLRADIGTLSALAYPGQAPRDHSFPERADALDFLMAHAVEPSFSRDTFTFVRDFPAGQAAQAQVRAEDKRLAHRFEVYAGGMELANGFLELQDVEEYALRFTAENAKRSRLGKPELPPDGRLLEELKKGLPPCAGVALGLDRLLMFGREKSA